MLENGRGTGLGAPFARRPPMTSTVTLADLHGLGVVPAPHEAVAIVLSLLACDERDDAVKAMLTMAIQACRKLGKYNGICGQGPSDHPDFALWLKEQGIESMSLNPDTVVETWLHLARN